MALAFVGSEWMPSDGQRIDPTQHARKGEAAVLAADSGAGAVAEAAGRGGAAVVGRVPDAGAMASELVGAGVHTMVYDVASCAPEAWGSLEDAARRAGVRLRCGSHLARFAPVTAGVTANVGGHVSIVAGATESPGVAMCALAADVAMAAFGGAPQAVFASAPEDPDGEGEDGAGGKEAARGVTGDTAVMMRFSAGRSALISMDPIRVGGCVRYVLPPDIATGEIEVAGHGGRLRQASLTTGMLDATFDFAPVGTRGMSLPASRDERGLERYMPAMLAELASGEAPAWPPRGWPTEGGELAYEWVMDAQVTAPWQPARPTRAEFERALRDAAGASRPALLPLPSSLAHVMQAIDVSINTGAPVYLDQR